MTSRQLLASNSLQVSKLLPTGYWHANVERLLANADWRLARLGKEPNFFWQTGEKDARKMWSVAVLVDATNYIWLFCVLCSLLVCSDTQLWLHLLHPVLPCEANPLRHAKQLLRTVIFRNTRWANSELCMVDTNPERVSCLCHCFSATLHTFSYKMVWKSLMFTCPLLVLGVQVEERLLFLERENLACCS